MKNPVAGSRGLATRTPQTRSVVWRSFLQPSKNRKLLFNEDGSPSARTQAIWGHTPSFVTGIELMVDGGFLAQTI